MLSGIFFAADFLDFPPRKSFPDHNVIADKNKSNIGNIDYHEKLKGKYMRFLDISVAD